MTTVTEHLDGAIPRGMRCGRRELASASVLITASEAVPVHMRPGTREVSQLFVPHADRRQHIGTALMNLVCQEADANAITLLLIARPFGDGGPDEDQLITWYARFGFQILQDSAEGTVMARQISDPRRGVKVVSVH